MPLKRSSRAATVCELAKTFRASDRPTRSISAITSRVRRSSGRRRQVGKRRAELVVGLPVLVDQPDDLVRMANGVARKARRDHRVDRAPARFGQVEAAPGGGAADEVEALALHQRQRDEVGLDAPPRRAPPSAARRAARPRPARRASARRGRGRGAISRGDRHAADQRVVLGTEEQRVQAPVVRRASPRAAPRPAGATGTRCAGPRIRPPPRGTGAPARAPGARGSGSR